MKLLNSLFLISVGILAVATTIAYSGLSSTNDLILHFTQAGEPDYIGSQIDVIRVIGVAAMIVLCNYFLARSLAKKERFFTLGLATTGAGVSLLLLIAVSVIVINNR